MANALNQDIPQGTGVVLRGGENGYEGTEAERRFVCLAGFGLSAQAGGRAVFGHLANDRRRRRFRVEGGDVLKVSEDQTLSEPMTAHELALEVLAGRLAGCERALDDTGRALEEARKLDFPGEARAALNALVADLHFLGGGALQARHDLTGLQKVMEITGAES